MAHFIDHLLSTVPSWVVYLTVFLLPFLEAAVLLGFVIPGETALVFGGVLAGHHGAGQGHHVNLVLVLVLAIVGAVTGDTIGYEVGRHFGPAIKTSRLGEKVGAQRWEAAESFIHRRGGPSVFFGRWTALLRAIVPGTAGMSGMHYPTFLLWNAVGGAGWATACVLGGYAVGDVISRYLTYAGYIILGLVVVALAVHLLRKRSERRSEAALAREPEKV